MRNDDLDESNPILPEPDEGAGLIDLSETLVVAPAPPDSVIDAGTDPGSEGSELTMDVGLFANATASVPGLESEQSPSTVAPAGIESLKARIDELSRAVSDKLDGLRGLFEREVRAEATREKVVDRLHAELQEYKQDFLLSALRPVFIDLIGLHDDLGKVAGAVETTEPIDPARLFRVVDDARQAIEDILYRQGVETFAAEGDAFDPRRQRAVSTVPTDDPALNKTVAERLRPGFRAGEKVIRPEVVSVRANRPGG